MKKSALLLSAVLLFQAPARAQDAPIMALDPTLMAGWAGGEAVRYDLEKRAAAKGDRSAAPATGSFAYRSTPSTHARAVEQTASRARATNPQLAQIITAAFGPGKADFETTYAQILDGTGLHDNDAADAMAAYMLMGYAVVHTIQDGKAITVPMAQGVRAQVVPLLTANAQARGRAAQLGEEIKLQTVIVQGGWQAAMREGKLAAYRQGIGNLFRTQYCLNLSQIKLTNQRFVTGQ